MDSGQLQRAACRWLAGDAESTDVSRQGKLSHQARRLVLGLLRARGAEEPLLLGLLVAVEGSGTGQPWALGAGLTQVELVLPPQAQGSWVLNLQGTPGRGPAMATTSASFWRCWRGRRFRLLLSRRGLL